jgi:hypothetical protein
MSKSFAHVARAAALILVLGHPVAAQVSLQTTPPPTVTAENEAWYLNGEPVTFGGSVYYPAGPITHFQRNEMVRTGAVGNVPIYVRTTQEVGSVIYVPLAGGLMKPYERRRSGDLAGTVGSSAPSFRVVLPSENAPQGYVGAPVVSNIPAPVGTSGYVPASTGAAPEPSAPSPVPEAVGTSGILAAAPAVPVRTRIQTVQRPVGLNSVFVDFDGTRWFAAGPAVEFTPGRFTRIGEHRGFDVYQANGQTGTIYLSLLDGAPGLLAPYKRR